MEDNPPRVMERYAEPPAEYVAYFFENFKYRKLDDVKENRMQLRCTTNNCHKTITIDPNTLRIMTEYLGHNHPADPRKKINTLISIEMYRRVTTEHGSISQIYVKVTARHPQGLVPDIERRMRTFLRWRRGAQPAVPQTLAELDQAIRQPENIRYLNSLGGQPFYRGMVRQHTIIFLSPSTKGTLEVENATLNIDATFKAVPYIGEAKQTLAIMARTDDEPIPVCWVVMRRKNRAVYRDIFLCLRNLCPGLRPGLIITDFETALQAALKDVFPNCIVQGCWFCHGGTWPSPLSGNTGKEGELRSPTKVEIYTSRSSLSTMEGYG